jgi:flagellar protein FliT
MSGHLKVIEQPKYQGQAGVMAMRALQQALNHALQQEDWGRVRHLDRICVLLIDRVIAANRDDKSTLVRALGELKGVYAGLIAQCQQQVSLMANH